MIFCSFYNAKMVSCSDNNMTVECVIADAPERGRLAYHLGHTATFACLFCTLGALDRCWPPLDPKTKRKRVGTVRTLQQLEDILEDFEDLSVQER